MRISSQSRRRMGGTNPSPVLRRLEEAPSPDTLSPRERAAFSPTDPLRKGDGSVSNDARCVQGGRR
jgi:hypothetical protein